MLLSDSQIYSPQAPRDSDKGTDENPTEEKTTIAEHYGWLYTLYSLDETNILSITGDKCLTDLNVIFVFNYMSLQHEIVQEKNQEQQYGKFRK